MARRGSSLLGVIALLGLAGCGAAGSHASRLPATAANPSGCLGVSPRALARTVGQSGHPKRLPGPAGLAKVPCPPRTQPRRRATSQDATSPGRLVLTVPERVTTVPEATTAAPAVRPASRPQEKLTFVPVVR